MSKTILSACILLLTLSASCSSNNRYDPTNRSSLKVKDKYLLSVELGSPMPQNAQPASEVEKRALYYFTAKGGTLTAVKYGETRFTHFTTDAQGNVTAATGNKGGITFSYTNGLITSSTYYINGAARPQVTNYRYDARQRIVEENTVFADRNAERRIQYKYGDDGGNNPVASYHYTGHQIDTVSHYWGKLKSPYSTLPPIVHYLDINIPMGDCAVVAEVSSLLRSTTKYSYNETGNFIEGSYIYSNTGSSSDMRYFGYNK